MLSRIKFDIDILVNEILDQLPADVWTSASTTFLDPAIGGGQFIRAIENRLRTAGHSDDNISGRVYGCENSKLSVQYAKNKYKIVATLSAGDFLEKDFGNMKFDVVVGNPPFSARVDSTNKSTDLDSLFLKKAMSVSKLFAMIIRTKHFTNPKSKFRKDVFSSNRVSKISYVSEIYFPTITNTATCVVYGELNSMDTKIIYKDGYVQNKKLNNNSVIMFEDPEYSGPITDNLAYRWSRGKVNRNKIIEDSNGVDLIEVIDRKKGLIIKKVSLKLEKTGYKEHGVLLNVCADWGGLGRIEVKPFNSVVSGSIVFLKTGSEVESKELVKYLNSEKIKTIVKKNMASFHNTKTLFTNIPDIKC
jgi:hypothetical protein